MNLSDADIAVQQGTIVKTGPTASSGKTDSEGNTSLNRSKRDSIIKGLTESSNSIWSLSQLFNSGVDTPMLDTINKCPDSTMCAAAMTTDEILLADQVILFALNTNLCNNLVIVL
jgi:hypothetical protein